MIELRAIVADDSVVIRQGVIRILADGGFRIVAEVGDANALMDAVAAEKPHLAVVDIRMPPGGNAGLTAGHLDPGALPDRRRAGALPISRA